MSVWVGIINNQILGPYLFEENFTGLRYLESLQGDLLTQLNQLFPNRNDLWLKQDGAPPHNVVDVRTYLNKIFRGKCIGRRRSPDGHQDLQI